MMKESESVGGGDGLSGEVPGLPNRSEDRRSRGDEVPPGERVLANAAGGKAPDQPSGAEPRAPSGDDAPTGEPHAERADHIRVARVRCLDQVKAKGFTFARGTVVDGVPLAHAEYLAAGGKAEILEVSVS